MEQKSLSNIFFKRILIVVFFVVFIFVGLIIFFLSRHFYMLKVKDMQKLSINTAQNTKFEIEKNVRDIQLMIEYIKELIIQDVLDYNHLNIMISKVIENDPNVEDVDLYFVQNTVHDDLGNLINEEFIYHWYVNNKLKIKSDTFSKKNFHTYLFELKDGNKIRFFTPELRSGKNLYYVLPIGFPIKFGERVLGVLIVKVKLDFLGGFYKQMTEYDDFLIDPFTGKILYTRKDDFLTGNFYKTLLPGLKEKFFDLYDVKTYFIKYKKNIIFISPVIFDANQIWYYAMIVPARDLRINSSFIVSGGVLFFILIMIILFFLIRNFTTKISQRALGFAKEIENIKNGNFKTTTEEFSFKFMEVEQVVSSIKLLKERLNEFAEILKEISKGNYKEFRPLAENDLMAETVEAIVESIKQRETVEKEAIEHKKQNDWIRNGLAELHDATRIDENSYELLADRIIKTFITYSNAFLGGFFLFKKEKEKEFLEAISTFAYEEKKAYKKNIELGEGLVGTVALEKKLTYIENIPDSYHLILSGLSEMKPQSIIFVPVIFENVFYGIIELAYLKKLRNYEIEFLKQSIDIIGISLKTISSNITTEKLLKQYEKQKYELEETQKKLEAHIKELKAREQVILENEKKLQTSFNAINNTLLTLEYRPDGKILFVNEKFLEALHFEIDEIQGENLFKITLDEQDRKAIKNNIERIKEGQKIEGIIRRFDKFKQQKFFYATYTPVYDDKGSLEKIIFLGFDITDDVKKIQNLEREVRLLKKQLKLLR